MIVTVPVKPFVNHLLIKLYGQAPIPVHIRSDIGNMFVLAITKQKYLTSIFNYYEVDATAIKAISKAIEIPMDDDISTKLAEAKDESEEKLVSLDFQLSAKFDSSLLVPGLLAELGKCMESFARIYMKAYSVGYRTLLNSEVNSATVFHRLHDFHEDVLTMDNAIKIIQREVGKMKDPIGGKNNRRSVSVAAYIPPKKRKEVTS